MANLRKLWLLALPLLALCLPASAQEYPNRPIGGIWRWRPH
jgi:hypothetical protein